MDCRVKPGNDDNLKPALIRGAFENGKKRPGRRRPDGEAEAARHRNISVSSCPTCTGFPAPRPCRSTRSRATRSGGLNFYGGIQGLDTSSNVVPASAMHTQRNYADQQLFPDPNSFRVIPWLEKTASVVCLGYEYDGEPQRSAPRWVFSELVKAGERARLRRGDGPRIRVLPARRRDAGSASTKASTSSTRSGTTMRRSSTSSCRRCAPTASMSSPTIANMPARNTRRSMARDRTSAAADKAFAFKNGMKELAHRNGYIASFMAKPFAGHVRLRLPPACQPGEPPDEEERLLRRWGRRRRSRRSAHPSSRAS